MANNDDNLAEDNLSELTDDDKFEGAQYPPDRPLGVCDRTVDRDEDSVGERMAREIPEREGSGHHDDEVGTLVDPAADFDDEPDAVALEARDERDPLGIDVAVQDLEEVEPAEEAAMHLTEDPPMGDGDGYVED